jgi:pyruvate formate lyase activating enzyme
MEINYAGFIPISTVDWSGRSVATIFLRGCNLNCAYCQNRRFITGQEMVKMKYITDQIFSAKPFISGVIISGGEPLMQCYQVWKLAKWCNMLGLKVGIHTNGCYPEEMQDLLLAGLVDKFFIDIKAPLDDEYLFSRVVGCKDNIRNMMSDIAQGIKYATYNIKFAMNNFPNGFDHVELRTTVISGFVDSRWHIERISLWISDYLSADVPYVIQQGNPEHCRHLVDRVEQYRSDNHYKDRINNPEIAIIPREDLIEMAKVAKRRLRDVRIRTQERGEEKI